MLRYTIILQISLNNKLLFDFAAIKSSKGNKNYAINIVFNVHFASI